MYTYTCNTDDLAPMWQAEKKALSDLIVDDGFFILNKIVININSQKSAADSRDAGDKVWWYNNYYTVYMYI